MKYLMILIFSVAFAGVLVSLLENKSGGTFIAAIAVFIVLFTIISKLIGGHGASIQKEAEKESQQKRRKFRDRTIEK